MSKWRPASSGGIYVITDIHGRISELQNICSRILPLRRNSKITDKIIFLGDYIDRKTDSYKVLDYLISLKKKYSDQIVFLMGNHEWFLLQAMEIIKETGYDSSEMFRIWKDNGGQATLFGYLNKKNIQNSPSTFLKHRLVDIIPKEHIDFLSSLQYYYKYNEYIFVHAGCNPYDPIESQGHDVLLMDSSLCHYSMLNKSPLPWDRVFITGHNSLGSLKEEPIIRDKYYMLDCGLKKLLCVELISGESFVAITGNQRLVKYNLPIL